MTVGGRNPIPVKLPTLNIPSINSGFNNNFNIKKKPLPSIKKSNEVNPMPNTENENKSGNSGNKTVNRGNKTVNNGNGIRGNIGNRGYSSNNITGNSSSSRGNRVNRVNSSNNNTRNSSSSEGKDMPKLTKKDFFIFIVGSIIAGGILFGFIYLIYFLFTLENEILNIFLILSLTIGIMLIIIKFLKKTTKEKIILKS